jgi:AP-3 complex subunit beta
VVLAVCSLHYYCGTQTEAACAQLGKSLVRISRNRREIAFVVLQAIAAMAQERPAMFRPFLPDFFVKATDPSFCRALKLDILTALVDAANVTPVLRELQSYVKHGDKDFVCAAVRAVGRVADAQPEVAPRCLHGLMGLLACVRSEKVAGQAVVVIRQLLQQRRAAAAAQGGEEEAAGMGPVVKQLASVLISDKGQRVGPEARASLVWIVGEFIGFVRPAAPDVLRLLAKGFAEEAAPVKMQVVNLAVKLYLHHHKHTHGDGGGGGGGGGGGDSLLGADGGGGGNGGSRDDDDDDAVAKLVRYVLELARFDANYDLRDRTRLLTASLGLAPAGGGGGQASATVDAAALVALRAKAEEVFLPPKLPPLTLQGPVAAAGRAGLTVGSLSWMLHHKVPGYQELPDWAPLPSDPAIRDPPRAPATPAAAGAGPEGAVAASGGGGAGVFYSEDEDEEGSSFESGEESSSRDSSELDSGSDSGSESESASESAASAASPYSDTGSAASPSSGSESGYSSSSSSSSSSPWSGSGSGSSYTSDDEGEGVGGGNGKGAAHKRPEERRAGYDELGLGLSPPRPQKAVTDASSADAGLLDLEAYATAKNKGGSSGRKKGGDAAAGAAGSGGEGDLAAILQGLHATSLGGVSGGGGLSSSLASSSSSSGPRLSAPRELLRPETAGGLRVEAVYVRGGGGGAGAEEGSKGDTRAVVLRFHNTREAGAPLRHIRVAAAGAAHHPRLVPPLPEVAVLETGTVREARLLIDLKVRSCVCVLDEERTGGDREGATRVCA